MTRHKIKPNARLDEQGLSGEELKTVATNFVTSALELAKATEQKDKDDSLRLSSSCFAVMVSGCRNADAMADAIEQAVQATGDPKTARQALARPMQYAVEQAKQRCAERNRSA